MKSTQKQRERIIENLFDILMQTQFKNQARIQMSKDLFNKNVSLDKSAGTIAIQNDAGTIDQYLITIT